jgi:hypothetical protein
MKIMKRYGASHIATGGTLMNSFKLQKDIVIAVRQRSHVIVI